MLGTGSWVVWALVSVACFAESPTSVDEGGDTQATGSTTGPDASEGSPTDDTSATSMASTSMSSTSMPSTSAADDTTGTSSAASDDTADATSESSDSTGTPGFDPCPQLIEAFEECPGAPWMTNGSGTVACDGDAVLDVTAAVDGNVQLVLPVGLVDATAVVDLGAAPAVGMLKMLRVRTPSGQILAFRINAQAAGPLLEAYLDDMGATSVLEGAPHDPTEHRWVRVRENDGQLHFEVSADGTSFVAFHMTETPFDLTNATVGIAAGNYQMLAGDTEVRFGQFEYACTGRP